MASKALIVSYAQSRTDREGLVQRDGLEVCTRQPARETLRLAWLTVNLPATYGSVGSPDPFAVHLGQDRLDLSLAPGSPT